MSGPSQAVATLVAKDVENTYPGILQGACCYILLGALGGKLLHLLKGSIPHNRFEGSTIASLSLPTKKKLN